MLRRHGYDARVVTFDTIKEAINFNPDIIVIPRLDVRWLNDWILRLRDSGKIVVYDSDDDVWSDEIVTRQVAFRDEGESESRHKLEARREILDNFSGVTVTTPALAERARKYTSRPVIVVPNCLDAQWFMSLAEHEVRPVTIGWGGGWRLESTCSRCLRYGQS